MIVKNNDIYLTRGENGTVNVVAWNSDGTPFVVPPLPSYHRPLLALAERTELENGERYRFYSPLTFLQNPDVEELSWYNCEIELKDETVGAEVRAFTYELGQTHGSVKTGTMLRISGNEGLVELEIRGAKLVALHAFYKEAIDNVTGVTYDAVSDAPVTCLAFTVRAANYDKIVLTKYLNLLGPTMRDGETDYSPLGWNKFGEQLPISYDTLDEAFDDLTSRRYTKEAVAQVDNKFYHLALTSSGLELQPYEFGLTIPLMHEDTKDLEAGEYVYDIIAYQGIITSEAAYKENVFPYSEVLWKKEIVSPHKFVIGDSNNA